VVLADGGMRGQPFQPLFIVLVQTRLVVIDENTRGDVHRVHKVRCHFCGIPLSSPSQLRPLRPEQPQLNPTSTTTILREYRMILGREVALFIDYG
jgi:hypothetical protein